MTDDAGRASTGGASPVLDLAGLEVRASSGHRIVEGLDLQLGPGEVLGLVGESGSGKTTVALALLGYSADGVKIDSGALNIGGRRLAMDDSMRRSRGAEISYIPQDPSRALNPSMRVAAAIRDVIAAHKPKLDEDLPRVMLATVGLPDSPEFGRRFPHQLSGGQQQRVAIAMALACEPGVVVLDEPTTGLDVVTQARILTELRRLRDEREISMVYITHDLAVVAEIAERIAVMYAGRIVELGPADEVLRRPRHPYTRGLLVSIPDHVRPRALEPMPGIAVGIDERPSGCAFAARCPQRLGRCDTEVPSLSSISEAHLVRCFNWERTPSPTTTPLPAPDPSLTPPSTPVLAVEALCAEHRSRGETVTAAENVTFEVARGACVALVGESGSGKTTIARAIAGLHPLSKGSMTLGGEALPSLVRSRTVDQRRGIQLVAQNPADALNPRRTVGDAIVRPLRVLRGMNRRTAEKELGQLVEWVRLPPTVVRRYPHELSGGERQRIAIARALAAQPDVMLCDEITSALDVSVQAAVLALLNELRGELGLSLLFITHDLGVVATVADEVIVLDSGHVCEQGMTRDVLSEPTHPYTQRLLAAAPSIGRQMAASTSSM
jgi:peptide/nickel transport system ATP-binding protein